MNEPKTDKEIQKVCGYLRDRFMDNIAPLSGKKYDYELMQAIALKSIAETLDHFKITGTETTVRMAIKLYNVIVGIIEAGTYACALIEKEKAEAIKRMKNKAGVDNETKTYLH